MQAVQRLVGLGLVTGVKHKLCGIFAYSGPDAAYNTSLGLYALQHRGQEASGIVSYCQGFFQVHKNEGLVSQVYRDIEWDTKLQGSIAIGHNRYGTSNSRPSQFHAQPSLLGTTVLCHNGHIPDTNSIDSFLKEKNLFIVANDTEKLHQAIEYYIKEGVGLDFAIRLVTKKFPGAYSLIAFSRDEQVLVAYRGAEGIRPLVVGVTSDDSYVISSETCGLDAVNARILHHIPADGMFIYEQERDVVKWRCDFTKSGKLDAFEYIYLSRPDSVYNGESVQKIRERLGSQLANYDTIIDKNSIDMVIGIPDSGIPAAIGYAHQSQIPYRVGFINSRYSPRTFITPGQTDREKAVLQKLHVLSDIVRRKNVIVTEDSIVRGTTAKTFVRLLRQAGAKSIHLRIASPEVRYPDFYGIDIPNQSELLAFNKTNTEMCTYLGVDSLLFLPLGRLVKGIGVPKENLNLSCFTGVYPVDIGERANEVQYL